MASVLSISACNSGGSTSTPGITAGSDEELEVIGDTDTNGAFVLTQANETLPQDAIDSGGAGLVMETIGDCTTAGEPITLALFARDASVGTPPEEGSAQTGNNVTAYTAFALEADSAESSVEVISHTDLLLSLQISSPDIISLAAQFGDNSVTDFIAAWPADAPGSAVLIRERDNGVCFYSMRLPGFCGTTRSTGASSQMSFADHVLEFSGCSMSQIPNLPVIRIN